MKITHLEGSVHGGSLGMTVKQVVQFNISEANIMLCYLVSYTPLEEIYTDTSKIVAVWKIKLKEVANAN